MEIFDKDLVFFIHPESGIVCHKNEDFNNMDSCCEEVSQEQWVSILRGWGHDPFEMKKKDLAAIKERLAEKRGAE